MTIERKLDGAKPKTRMPEGATDTQIHLYLDGFPAQHGGPPLPERLPGIDEYRRVMNRLGITRVVVTTGNAHQLDNSCLAECLDRLRPIAKGVAAITGETPDAEMERLTDAGVCGARIMNLPGGAVGLDALEAVDRKASEHGWMLAVQFDGSHILDHLDRLAALRSRWVFDHHGKFFSGASPDGVEADAVKRLLDGGNCWFKFAGCYESSKDGPPEFRDIAALSRVVADHAPERIVWGTNWPHNLITRTEDYPDDAVLLDTVLGWVPERHQRLVLVDNPAELYGFPAS